MSGTKKRNRVFVNYTQDDFQNGKIKHTQFTKQYEEKIKSSISPKELNFGLTTVERPIKKAKILTEETVITKPKSYKFIDYAPKVVDTATSTSTCVTGTVSDVYLEKLNRYRPIVPKVNLPNVITRIKSNVSSIVPMQSLSNINSATTLIPPVNLNVTPTFIYPVSASDISVTAVHISTNPNNTLCTAVTSVTPSVLQHISSCTGRNISSIVTDTSSSTVTPVKLVKTESPAESIFDEVIIKQEPLDNTYDENDTERNKESKKKKLKSSFIQILEHLHDVAKDRNKKNETNVGQEEDEIQQLHTSNLKSETSEEENLVIVDNVHIVKPLPVVNTNVHVVKPLLQTKQRKQLGKSPTIISTPELDLAISLTKYCHQVAYHLVQNRFPTLQVYAADNNGQNWLVIYPRKPYFFEHLGPFTDYIRLVIKADETYNFQVLHRTTQSGQFDRKAVKKVLEIMTCSSYALCVGLKMLPKYKDWIESEQESLIRKWPELDRVDSQNCLLWHHASHRLSPDSEIHKVCRKCREILYSLKRKQYMAKDGYYCHND